MAVRGLSLLVFSAAAGLIAGRQVCGEVFVHDQFEHQVDGAPLGDGPLEGRIPFPGPGVAWDARSAGGVNPVQVVGGQAVVEQRLSANSEDIGVIFPQQSATATTYMRFDFRIPAAENAEFPAAVEDPLSELHEGVFFVSLRTASSGQILRGRTGLLPPMAGTGGDFAFAVNASASNLAEGARWPTDLDFDTTYRAIVNYNAANGHSQLWINPSSEASPSVLHQGTATGSLIDLVLLRQNDDYDGKQLIDNLVVASTFADALSGGGGGTFLAADFNEDGAVDGTDLAQWAGDFGLTAGAAADADGDGDSDGDDFLIWQQQFGGSSAAAATTFVPEPSAALVFGLGMLVAGLRRRRGNPKLGAKMEICN